MVKKRIGLNIHCKHCPVASLCIANSLKPLEIEKINAIITQVHFIHPGEHLYFQHQKIQYLFAVYTGACKEYSVEADGTEKINNFYFPGDILAIESVSSGKHIFSAVALETSQFCAIPIELFFQQMAQYPALMNRFIHLMSDKLKKDKYIPVTTNAKRRIAAFLLDILYRIKPKETQVDHIHLPMSQFDIGNLLGLAHETVSRTLHCFQHKHIIKILNKEIYITDIDSLKSIAHSNDYIETRDMPGLQ